MNGLLTNSFRLDAMSFAIVLSGETVVVTVATAPPETRAAAVFHIKEPFNGKVAA